MELNCSATSNTEAYYNESGDTVTYTFGGKFVKWTATMIWGGGSESMCLNSSGALVIESMCLNSSGAWVIGSMCLNSSGAWVIGFPLEEHSLSYNHREGKHFLKIFRHSAIQTGERH